MTGLVPAFLYTDGTPGWASNDAWVRDSVYTCISIWGTSIAFRRQADTEEDRLTAFQLEQVKKCLLSSYCDVCSLDLYQRSSCLHPEFSQAYERPTSQHDVTGRCRYSVTLQLYVVSSVCSAG